jgi:hypothetical protein
MGCRTGISTTTLQKRFPNADIYAIDPNKSSRDVLRYKLGSKTLDMQDLVTAEIITKQDMDKLENYWNETFQEINADNIHIMSEDMKTADEEMYENSDFVTSLSFVHWVYGIGGEKGLANLFETANNYLAPEGTFVFNSFMDFCSPIDSESKNFVNHPLVKSYFTKLLENLEILGFKEAKLKQIQLMNADKYVTLLSEAGFEIVEMLDVAMPWDIKTFESSYKDRTEHAGVWDKVIISDEDKNKLMEDIMDETLEDYTFEPEHKAYEFSVNPTFVARKI